MGYSPGADGMPIASVRAAVAVTPNDAADLARKPTRAVYIGGAGNLSVIMDDGVAVTFNGLAVGVVHRIAVDRINLTGTTATNIIALYE